MAALSIKYQWSTLGIKSTAVTGPQLRGWDDGQDGLYILDGPLEQQTVLRPTELMADTAGYSDVVFGLSWLLGYQFSPRLADIGRARFWRMDQQTHYGALEGIARHRIN
jgi:TnpA family transposase